MTLLPLMAAMALTLPGMGMDQAKALHRQFESSGITGDAVVEVELVVRPDGRIASCDVVRAKGDDRAAAAFCPFVGRTSLSKVARIDGKPAFAKIRTILSSGDNAREIIREFPKSPDVMLDAASAPVASDAKRYVFVAALVGEDGAIRECNALNDAPALYVDVACRKLGNFDVMRDETGKPVSYVTSKIVGFSASGER
jgi:hypothetical protein